MIIKINSDRIGSAPPAVYNRASRRHKNRKSEKPWKSASVLQLEEIQIPEWMKTQKHTRSDN